MPEVVELMAIDFFKLPTGGARPRVGLLRIDRARWIEVAVLFLSSRDLLNQAVNISLEFRIGMNAQRVSGAFNHFVKVAVVERVRWKLLVLELALERGCGAIEILDAAVLLALLKGERNRHRPIDLDARRPKFVVEVDRGKRDRLDGVITLRLSGPFLCSLVLPGSRDDNNAEKQGGYSEEQPNQNLHARPPIRAGR